MIQKGDILLHHVDTTSIKSRIVSWLLRSKYTHVALAVSETEKFEADIFIETGRYTIDFSRHMTILRLKPEFEQFIDPMVTAAEYYRKAPYDLSGAIAAVIKRLFHLDFTGIMNYPNHHFCSELLDLSAIDAGLDLFEDKFTEYLLPEDFLYNDKFDVIEWIPSNKKGGNKK